MSDLSMSRGDTGVFRATFTDGGSPPQLIDDPAAVYRMTIKRFASDEDPGIASVIATQVSPGVAVLNLQPSATADLECPNGVLTLVYDIQVTESDGRITTIASGAFYVLADVSLTTP
jgi:hypothetical protein